MDDVIDRALAESISTPEKVSSLARKFSQMSGGGDGTLRKDAALRELLAPLTAFLGIDGATDVCVNRPGEVYVEAGASWRRCEAPAITLDKMKTLARAIANYTDQDISEKAPILSATLPDGERIQIIQAPAVDQGALSITIRVPSHEIRTLESYEKDGAFDRYIWAESADAAERFSSLIKSDQLLMEHLRGRRLREFLTLAILSKKNICVVGDTGSGKTTLMKALCQIIPGLERLITIEDVRELFLPMHGNVVHLLYSAGKQGVADVSAQDLIRSCMRMKPDRVLLAELRGAEAFDFLKLLTTGHSGSITSYHAESCALAAERYVFMSKEHPQASIYDANELKRLVSLTVDIVLHVTAEKIYDEHGEPLRKERYVTEVMFDPIAKLQARFGAARVHGGGA